MVIPHNLIWCNTAAAEPSAAVLTGLCVLSLVIYLRNGRTRHLYVMVTLIPLVCQMRLESMLILGWTILVLLCMAPTVVVKPQTLDHGFIDDALSVAPFPSFLCG